MKSQRMYLFLPRLISQVLFTIEGTVSKGFPPLNPMNSWVFPDPLSPIMAIYFLLLLDFLLFKMMSTIRRAIPAMM